MLAIALAASALLAADDESWQSSTSYGGEGEAHEGSVSAEVVGWSADETRYVVRHMVRSSGSDNDERSGPCPGYVDAEGKKFRGALRLVLFKDGKEIDSWGIQGAGECTPPKEARANLAKAKQALAAAGVDLQKPGAHASTCGAPIALPSGLQVQCENTIKEVKNTYKDENGKEVEDIGTRIAGAMIVRAIKDGKKSDLIVRQFDWACPQAMASFCSIYGPELWVSPGGKRVVAFGTRQFTSGRGSEQTVFLAGEYAFPEVKAAK